MNQSVPQITVRDLQNLLQQQAAPVLLDVREDHELALCALPGCKHIPLGQLTTRRAELSEQQPIVVYCHHGGRSQRAAQWLQQQGFANVSNLTGGIDAWAAEIDPRMTRY